MSDLDKKLNDSLDRMHNIVDNALDAIKKANEAEKRTEPALHKHLVSNSVCPKCGKSKITDIWFNQFRCNSCNFIWGK